MNQQFLTLWIYTKFILTSVTYTWIFSDSGFVSSFINKLWPLCTWLKIQHFGWRWWDQPTGLTWKQMLAGLYKSCSTSCLAPNSRAAALALKWGTDSRSNVFSHQPIFRRIEKVVTEYCLLVAGGNQCLQVSLYLIEITTFVSIHQGTRWKVELITSEQITR